MNLSDWHSVLSNFAVILFAFAVVCDMLHYLKVSVFFRLGSWAVFAGTGLVVAALVTGLLLEGFWPATQDVWKHALYSYFATIACVIYFWIRAKAWDYSAIVYVALSLAVVMILAWV